MTDPAPVIATEQNLDRVLSALVGVVDYAVVRTGRRVTGLNILRDPAVEEHQLVRNVVSGLGAGCGLRLMRESVRVFVDRASFDAARAVPVEAVTVPAVAAGGNGHSGCPEVRRVPALFRLSVPGPVRKVEREPLPQREPVPASDRAEARPAAVALPPSGDLRPDRLELEHRGATIRCRVMLVLGARIYSAIAEVPASATAEAEVAARVTLDALRAGALVASQLDGVGITSIQGTTYVVAAVREPGGGVTRSGAAPIVDSMARAASAAVLSALGPITMEDQAAAELRLGSLLSFNSA
jgi:hypothetical protein